MPNFLPRPSLLLSLLVLIVIVAGTSAAREKARSKLKEHIYAWYDKTAKNLRSTTKALK